MRRIRWSFVFCALAGACASSGSGSGTGTGGAPGSGGSAQEARRREAAAPSTGTGGTGAGDRRRDHRHRRRAGHRRGERRARRPGGAAGGQPAAPLAPAARREPQPRPAAAPARAARPRVRLSLLQLRQRARRDAAGSLERHADADADRRQSLRQADEHHGRRLHPAQLGPATLPTGVTTALEMSSLMRINADIKYVTQLTVHPPSALDSPAARRTTWTTSWSAPGCRSDPNAGGDSSYEGSYPDVETTGVAMTDTSQRYDLTHEFFHVLENAYGTIPGQKVSWIRGVVQRLPDPARRRERRQRHRRARPRSSSCPRTSATWTRSSISSRRRRSRAAASSRTRRPSPGRPTTSWTAPASATTICSRCSSSQRVGMHFFAAVWEQAKSTSRSCRR